MKNDVIEHVSFSELNVQDSFFETLISDYPGFEDWFMRKGSEKAYVLRDDSLRGFLYLKEETEADISITPTFIKKRRLKIGTFKIEARGTVLGERFIGIALQKMISKKFEECYVTVFEKQESLIKLFKKFGFKYWGQKSNGESVYVKDLSVKHHFFEDYPRIKAQGKNVYMLSIYPKYHTKLFPMSILKTEKNHIIEDLSFTNTIEKVYISGMNGLEDIKPDDVIVIYRTAESGKKAEWSAVATSICTAIESVNINSFKSSEDFITYCGKGTVFSENELKRFWNTKQYPVIIKMVYNIPLSKRIVRHDLIENEIIGRDVYAGFMSLSYEQFIKLIEMGGISENFIIN